MSKVELYLRGNKATSCARCNYSPPVRPYCEPFWLWFSDNLAGKIQSISAASCHHIDVAVSQQRMNEWIVCRPHSGEIERKVKEECVRPLVIWTQSLKWGISVKCCTDVFWEIGRQDLWIFWRQDIVLHCISFILLAAVLWFVTFSSYVRFIYPSFTGFRVVGEDWTQFHYSMGEDTGIGSVEPGFYIIFFINSSAITVLL